MFCIQNASEEAEFVCVVFSATSKQLTRIGEVLGLTATTHISKICKINCQNILLSLKAMSCSILAQESLGVAEFTVIASMKLVSCYRCHGISITGRKDLNSYKFKQNENMSPLATVPSSIKTQWQSPYIRYFSPRKCVFRKKLPKISKLTYDRGPYLFFFNLRKQEYSMAPNPRCIRVYPR